MKAISVQVLLFTGDMIAKLKTTLQYQTIYQ